MLIAEVARVVSRVATDYLTIFKFLKKKQRRIVIG